MVPAAPFKTDSYAGTRAVRKFHRKNILNSLSVQIYFIFIGYYNIVASRATV